MRHRLELQKRTATQSGSGAETNEWETIDTVWAAIEPLAGRELIAAQTRQAETTGKIRIRFRPDVSPAMRGKFGDKIYNFLTAIDMNERNREIWIFTSEGVNEG